jgi:hypothetical protein
MGGDVRHDGTSKQAGGVMPAELAARGVGIRVEPVARLGGQIDAADERNMVVDHGDLLVVAMQGSLLRVRNRLDPRARRERVESTRHVLAIGVEERQRRAGPNQDTHRNPLGQLCEERPQFHPVGVAHECEVWCHEPAGEMDVRTRFAQLVGKRG